MSDTIKYKSGNIYTGKTFQKKAYGKGTMTFADGQYHGYKKYVGEFLNDKMMKGKMTFQNGDVYEGEFFNNEMHGKGVLTKQDGSIIHAGVFKDGKIEDSSSRRKSSSKSGGGTRKRKRIIKRKIKKRSNRRRTRKSRG